MLTLLASDEAAPARPADEERHAARAPGGPDEDNNSIS